MGNRFTDLVYEKYPFLGQGSTWGKKSGSGKYWKRCLHKARRREIRSVLRGETHPRTAHHYESMCNWKAS